MDWGKTAGTVNLALGKAAGTYIDAQGNKYTIDQYGRMFEPVEIVGEKKKGAGGYSSILIVLGVLLLIVAIISFFRYKKRL